MKKWCKVLLTVPLALALVSAVFIGLPVGAVAPSANCSIYNGQVTWSYLNIPSGDVVDTWQLQFRASGTSNWVNINTGSGPQAEGYIIPDSQYIAGNSFRVKFQLASDGSDYTSNVVSIENEDVHFTLSINDNGVVSWSPVYVPVTLHFRWLNNWVEDPDWFMAPAGSQVFNLYTTEYNTVSPRGTITEFYTQQYARTLEIYGTCVIHGVTYTSNTVYRLGTDIIASPPITAEPDITSPQVVQISDNVSLLYDGVKSSKYRVYFLTIMVTLLPMVGIAFIVKHWS